TLNVDELLVLHSEPSLLTNERLFLASGDGESGLQLYTDYQTLFARLVPDAVIAENVGSLVANAWQHVRDDPDRTQRELQEIAQFGHADAYRELISFYRLRRSNVGVLGHAAFRLWQVTEDGSDPQLWTVVRDMLAQSWYTTPNWPASVSPEFAEDVWRRAGAVSEGEGLVLAEWFREAQDYARAADVLRTIVGTGSPAPDVVASCIDAYVDAGQAAEADDLVQGYRAPYARDHAFAMAWGRHAMDRRDIGSLMDFASLLPDMLNENPPDLAAIELGNKVVKEIGLEDDWRGVLRRRLPALVDTQLPVITMMRYYVAYAEVDLLDAFEQAFEGSPYLDEIQQRVGLGVLRSGRQSPYGAHPVRRK
ncbi:hypothetical protein HOI71_24510, partial [Candidatus Poribacteria bacterium]|nr:hypothetical protein [Candidatus Poribacteria bacterium]